MKKLLDSYSDGLQIHQISVVIATLGGATLPNTIEILNRGTIVPREILICIPEEVGVNLESLQFDNVKVIRTVCRGQVAQRAVGFQQVTHDFVMQLDDDMFVDAHCIEHLLETLLKYPDSAVAPALIDVATNKSVYKKPQRGDMIEKIYYWLMNGKRGYREGEIEKSGSPVGIDPAKENKGQYEVEWLAGGCVMHRRKNLVLENFYPFPGKAYCEDIIHSYHLRQKAIRLMIAPHARCGLELVSPVDGGWGAFLKEIRADFRARQYFMRLSARGLGRMYLFYALRICSYLYKSIARWVKA